MPHIDTVKLIKTVRKILKNAQIPQYLFAEEVLGTQRHMLKNLLVYPKKWALCQDYKKRLYQKMNEWAQSPEESIRMLKNKAGNENNAAEINDSRIKRINTESEGLNEKAKQPNTTTQQQSIAPIDTFKLSESIRNLLKNAKISQETFATEILGIHFNSLSYQLFHPKPWEQCNDVWKQHYRKMFEWSRLPGSCDELKELISKNDNKIDTIKLTSEIKQLLKDSNIFYRVFAKEVLRISNGAICHMLRTPKEWTQCPNEWKRRYQKMHEWIKSPAESIILLKKMSRNHENVHDKHDANIDTVKLVYEIRKILRKEKIPHKHFAKCVLGISRTSFSRILFSPATYTQCRSHTKEVYRKMLEWIKSPDESIDALRASLDVDNNGNVHNIDTIELANTVKARLKKERLKQYVFGKEVLGIQTDHIYQLLSYPQPWSNCSDLSKKLFSKMHHWNQAPEDSIKSMKVLTSEMDKLNGESIIVAQSCENGSEGLDTSDLVERINKLLVSKGITKTRMRTTLGMSKALLSSLMHFPAPWHLLNKVKKEHYTKLHAWLVQNEVKTKTNESLNKLTAEKDETGAMNTVQVANEIVQLLKINGVSEGYFACQKLKIVKAFFVQLVYKPKSFSDLTDSERKIFQCMKKWTEPGEVESLKQGYDVYVARNQKRWSSKK
jgi:hypothetical protein